MEQDFQKPNTISPWLLIALIVVILAGVGFFGWIYWQKKTANPAPTIPAPVSTTSSSVVSTADWKTYTNDQYGFSFKYPTGWIVNTKDPKGITLNSPQSVADKTKCTDAGESPYCKDDLTVFYFDTINGLTNNSNISNLDDFIAKTSVLDGSKKITIGGYPAYEGIKGDISAYYVIYIEKDSHIYEIFFGKRSTKAELTSIETQILSTFQFTK